MPPGQAYRASLGGGAARSVPSSARSGPGSAYRASTATQAPAAPPKKSGGGGFLHAIEHLPGNLAKGIGERAVGIPAGVVHLGKLEVSAISRAQGDPVRAAGYFGEDVAKETGKSYASYYGHDPLGHIAKDPTQFGLDALTLLDLGTTAGVRAGLVSGDRAALVTRSPRAIATGKGPKFTDLSSTKPIVRIRETTVAARRTAQPEGRAIPGTSRRLGGGETKQYGKQIQARATQHALVNVKPYDAFHKATRGLSHDEWAALHIRAMDIHPDELKAIWKGTPNERDLTPRAAELASTPSKKILAAEPVVRQFAKQAEKLSPNLKEETAAARPGLTKRQAAETLGRPVKGITGEPYYFPHTQVPEKAVSPLAATGGGKGIPRLPGTTKQNLGRLFFAGKLHLRSDVLGPEFLRRVKYVKYDEIHKGLVRGAVRVTPDQIKAWPGGRIPQGWEYVRERASTRVPPTLRGEGTTHVPINELIPNAGDLQDSQLAKDGFSTTEIGRAHESGGKYYIVPKSTVKAATGEFTRSSDFVHRFVRQPLSVWRAAVLGLRVGFLTNNLVGNSLMYAVKTGGQGALRDLFMSIKEQHGPEVAKKILDNAATPPALRRSLYDEFFPEQGAQGTFGGTQSPATSTVSQATRTTSKALRSATGALPRLTSKVAEEAPRRALVRHYIRHSPEFRQVYRSLPKDTRSFETAARQVLEGKGGAEYQRYISKRVNQALGDYLHLSPVERNVLRNTLPFYSWYRAIVTTTYHLAVDTPLRANILGQIGQIGLQHQVQGVPSFLAGSIPLGAGKGGTQKVLGTQGLNPWATLDQLRRGSLSDVGSLGLNPYAVGPLETYGRAAYQQHTPMPHVSPGRLAGETIKNIATGLPPAQLASPLPPSKLYPNRNRLSTFWQFLGAPVKEYNPAIARQQAQQGR